MGDSSPPSDTSVPPAQFPSPDDPRQGFPATLRAPTATSRSLLTLLSTLRPRHHFCHQRTLALMELDPGCHSAPPVAFRWLPHQQTQRFVPCGTLQRPLRLPLPHLHPATLGAGFRRRSIVSRSLFMVLASCPSSKTLRMCSPTSSCCHGMLPISTTSTRER